MAAVGWGAYKPERDVQGSEWAREREERRVDALAARAVFGARRREEADAVGGAVAVRGIRGIRGIRAVADRSGLQPAQVLAQLAERVVVSEDGTVSVSPFAPSR